MDGSYAFALAPNVRLGPEASRLVVDFLFAGGLVLAVVIAVTLAYRAWSSAQKLGAEVWKRRGLRAGPILLPGVAHPLESEPSDEDAHFIELEIQQNGVQRSGKGGPFVVWTETSRSLTERPFELRCEGGEVVRVEPSGQIELIDRLDTYERIGPQTRRRVAHIVDGETVWIRGELTDTSVGTTGPYRASSDAYRWVLRPSPRDKMYVSSQPVEAEGRAAMKLHAIFAVLFIGVLVLCQSLFADFRALRAHGVVTDARIDNRRMWVTHGKNSTTTHWAFDLAFVANDGAHRTRQETNNYAYLKAREGDSVPLIYLPSNPTICELGPERELGLESGFLALSSVVTALTIGAYLAIWYARRPWWRRSKIIDTVKGTLK